MVKKDKESAQDKVKNKCGSNGISFHFIGLLPKHSVSQEQLLHAAFMLKNNN